MTGLIVHEWLGDAGGSERVVDAMREAYPGTKLVALWNDAPDKYRDVTESWLAQTPLRHHKALTLPFLPWTWRHLLPPNDDVDWMLVSSHLFAHHVDLRSTSGIPVPKYVYVHTPARYIWEPDLDKRGNSIVARTASAMLRPLDRKRAAEPRAIAANSEFVRERIRRDWHRDDSVVIYPPVDVAKIRVEADWRERLSASEAEVSDRLPDGFILGASRFVPYKRLDDVIRVAASLGRPVVIAGSGTEKEHLRAVAQETDARVTFILKPSNELLYTLYQRCSAYVFPAIEDFGIMPVEAMAAGARVVVGPIGGAAESVGYSGCGVVAERDTIASLSEATAQAIAADLTTKRDVEDIFGKQRFIDQIHDWMRSAH